LSKGIEVNSRWFRGSLDMFWFK